MQPVALKSPTKLEKRLDGLRSHPTVGPPVRLYFRRREQLLFLVVGAWNTLFGYSVWALMQYTLGGYVHYLVVAVLAWPFAVLNAYLCYRLIVFRSNAPIRGELPRFSLVYLATLGATLVLLPIALSVLPFNIYVVQVFLLALIVVGSYLGHKRFSFGSGAAGGASDESSEGSGANQESEQGPTRLK